MIKRFKQRLRKLFAKTLALFIATVGKTLVNLMLLTCRWKVQGLERFVGIASKEKCVLMMWHNRLALVSFILYRYARHFYYAAFVSNSRDGELISRLVKSYKTGRTIRVPHHSRHQALKELIRQLEEKQNIIIITPDGPRGPVYEMKPGLALAAIETEAFVVPLNWKATKYWEFNTWDKLRLPKPFSTIEVFFEAPVRLKRETPLAEAQERLQEALIF